MNRIHTSSGNTGSAAAELARWYRPPPPPLFLPPAVDQTPLALLPPPLPRGAAAPGLGGSNAAANRASCAHVGNASLAGMESRSPGAARKSTLMYRQSASGANSKNVGCTERITLVMFGGGGGDTGLMGVQWWDWSRREGGGQTQRVTKKKKNAFIVPARSRDSVKSTQRQTGRLLKRKILNAACSSEI